MVVRRTSVLKMFVCPTEKWVVPSRRNVEFSRPVYIYNSYKPFQNVCVKGSTQCAVEILCPASNLDFYGTANNIKQLTRK